MAKVSFISFSVVSMRLSCLDRVSSSWRRPSIGYIRLAKRVEENGEASIQLNGELYTKPIEIAVSIHDFNILYF